MNNKSRGRDAHENEPVVNQEAGSDIEVNDTGIDCAGENETLKDEVETEMSEVEMLQKQLDEAKAEAEKEKKEYLFLMAEFDNFRKRTLRERVELIKNASEKVLEGLLPIVDDFERSLQAINDSTDASSIREGVELIYNKFVKYLEQNGVKPIDSAAGVDFDTEVHEAVTAFPVEDDAMKGKVIDTVQKGYTLNDKVLRHAKVVVGK